jgi:uncharacterized protein
VTGLFGAAFDNLTSPMILAFVLGAAAGLARSDLSVPESVAKGLSIYLMFAIGLKGGTIMATTNLDARAVITLLAGIGLSLTIPLIAFGLLRRFAAQDVPTAAAVSAHYGSVSIVTFVTATEFLTQRSIGYEPYILGVVALMETPAVLTGLWLAGRGLRTPTGAEAGATTRGGALTGTGTGNGNGEPPGVSRGELIREILLNGSVVLLIGAFLIGWATGPAGFATVAPVFDDLFKGLLCLFLLDMGLQAARRLKAGALITPSLLLFGIYMPLIGAALGLVTGWLIGLSAGGVALIAILCASASYIAVPAAMRLAIPQANPGIYLTLALAVTFPFNVLIGIPLYTYMATLITGAPAP